MIEAQFTDPAEEAGYYPCCEHHEPGSVVHALPCSGGCNDD